MKTDTWLTPPSLIGRLGSFDLDPCAAPAPRPWPTAGVHYDLTAGQDGLTLPWFGFVWLNPPFSDLTPWLELMAGYRRGLALTPSKTETAWFHDNVWKPAAALLFLRGRVGFCFPDGRPTRRSAARFAPVLISYEEEGARRLARSQLDGHLVVTSALILRFQDGRPVGTWREALEAALVGRQMRVRDIYRAAEGTAKVREAKAAGHNWKAQIRRALQVYFRPIDYGVWAPA